MRKRGLKVVDSLLSVGKAKSASKKSGASSKLSCVAKAQEYFDADDAAGEAVEEVAEMISDNEESSDSDNDEGIQPNESCDAALVDQKDMSALRSLITNCGSKISDLNEKIRSFKDWLSSSRYVSSPSGNESNDDIVSYLTAKQQMLACYLTNLVFYIRQRIRGISVANHPVMNQMLSIRLALEKMRAIDSKIKHQVERLVASSTTGLQEANALHFNVKSKSKSSKHAYVDDHDEDEATSDAISGMPSMGHASAAGIYKPSRMQSVPYLDNEKMAEKNAEKIRRQRNKLRSSEIFETLREEFSSAPEVSASSGISAVSSDARKLQKEADERTSFEEERFVRLTMTRKDKKDINRRKREIDRLDRFDDFGSSTDFNKLVNMHDEMGNIDGLVPGDDNRGRKKSKKKETLYENAIPHAARKDKKRMSDVGASVNTSAAIERAAAAFRESRTVDTGVPMKATGKKSRRHN
eukprot:GSChrysophyteH1.ASY1.ANO1.2261.1 assembled CDS